MKKQKNDPFVVRSNKSAENAMRISQNQELIRENARRLGEHLRAKDAKQTIKEKPHEPTIS